jgi:predicted transcriptional regulator
MEQSMANTRVVTAHIPDELAQKVDRWAEMLERPRGWIVKQALADWIFNEEEKDRLTLEAIDDFEKHGGIPHEEVVAWVKSLSSANPLPRPKPRKL